MSKSTFYFALVVLVIVDVIQSKYQAKLDIERRKGENRIIVLEESEEELIELIAGSKEEVLSQINDQGSLNCSEESESEEIGDES